MILFSCALTHFSFAQPVIQWEKSIGGSGADFAKSICMISDSSGYYVSGYTNSSNGDIMGGHGAMDVVLSKLDLNGNLIWTRLYGGTDNDINWGVYPVKNKGAVLTGFSKSSDGNVPGNYGDFDIWVFAVDSNGIITWNKHYGGSLADGDHAVSLVPIGNKGWAMTASTFSNDHDVNGNHGIGDGWLARIDSVGNLLWAHCYGDTNDEDSHDLARLADGGFMLTGHTSSNAGQISGNHNPGTEDLWVFRTDSLGNFKWSRCFGGTDIEIGKAIKNAGNTACVIGGYTNSSNGDVTGNHGGYDSWMLKVDTSGTLLWQKTLGGTGDDFAASLCHDWDGGFMSNGQTASVDGDISYNHGPAGTYDFWVVKISSSGNLIWEKTYGGSSDDRGEGIAPTKNQGSVICGWISSFDGDITNNHGFMDMWVAKLSCAVPPLSFVPADTTICTGTALSFAAGSTFATNLSWYMDNNFMHSGSTYNNTFNAAGDFYLSLTGSYGICKDSIHQTITVNSFPVASFTPGDTAVCGSGDITYHATSPGEWYLNGVHIAGDDVHTFSYATPGIDTISFIASNGPCSDTVTHYLTVSPMPVVNLGNDTVLGLGQTVILDAGNPGAQYLWSTGDTTQQITAGAGGWTGTLSVIVSYPGCSAVDTIIVYFPSVIANENISKSITITPQPATDFITISREGDTQPLGEITLFDLSGRQVYSMMSDAVQQRIDLRGFEAGSYILQLRDEGNVMLRKLLIKR